MTPDKAPVRPLETTAASGGQSVPEPANRPTERREERFAALDNANDRIDRLKAEVERLREDATWAQLRAETGAERAQAEHEHQAELLEGIAGDDIDRLTAHRDKARATIDRAEALADAWDRIAHTAAHAYAKALRATLDSPTANSELTVPTPHAHEPGHDCTLTDAEDGYGTFLGHVDTTDDPPPVDPLAASKARIEAAMRGMEPT